jgi:hypothetical protein
MNIKPIKSVFARRVAVMLLTVLTTIGAWAQTATIVTDETQLNRALSGGD